MMMTPPERANKLTPRWKGPFQVKRVPNPYQVVYEDGSVWWTVYVNHTKPAKLTAPDLPLPTPALEPPRPTLGYLPRSLQRPYSRPPPPQGAAPARGVPPPPTASVPTPSAPPPPARQRPTQGSASANENSAPAPQPLQHPGSRIQPPNSAPANQHAGPATRPLRSARLNPGLDQACCIKGPPGDRAPQSQQSDTMARTYPHTLGFNQCLGAKEDPCAFSSVYLEDIRSGEREYISTVKQLITALPKTEDPASRIALRGHITPAGHQCLRHSMRAALGWLLPSDREFRRAPHALRYYLARQGWRVVSQGGNVTRPLYESCVNRVVDPAPPASRPPVLETSSAPTPLLSMPPSGDVPQTPRHQKSRRRRRRKAARPANQLPASRQADVTARLSEQPMIIRLNGEQPGPGQRPMTGRR